MSHPSLGAPPHDQRAAFPAAAQRLRDARARLGGRALEVAIERDPTIRERLGEVGLRKLLRDTESLVERLALAVSSGDVTTIGSWVDWVVPLYRRRKVPLDDIVNLCEGLRQASTSVLAPAERATADAAIDEGIRVLRWHRRLAGDARKRNRLLAAIYKGA